MQGVLVGGGCCILVCIRNFVTIYKVQILTGSWLVSIVVDSEWGRLSGKGAGRSNTAGLGV